MQINGETIFRAAVAARGRSSRADDLDYLSLRIGNGARVDQIDAHMRAHW